MGVLFDCVLRNSDETFYITESLSRKSMKNHGNHGSNQLALFEDRQDGWFMVFLVHPPDGG